LKKEVKKFCKSCNCGKDVPKLEDNDDYLVNEESNRSYDGDDLKTDEGCKEYQFECSECHTVYEYERHWITDNGGSGSSIDGKDACDYDSYGWQDNGIRYEDTCNNCNEKFVYSYDKYDIMKNEDKLCLKCTRKEKKEFEKWEKEQEKEDSYEGGFILN